MKLTKADRERFRSMLRDAYLSREPLETDSGWQDKVMRKVAHMDTIAESQFQEFGHFAWRLAPATLLVNVSLTVMIVLLYATTEYNGLQLVMNNLQLLALEHILGG